MGEDRIMNRWMVVIGALVIQISLGAVYIWSVFQTPLKRAFPSWTETQVTWPAQIVLVCFALAVICGGRIQDRLGPKKVATAGGLILGLGLILARFTGGFEAGAALWWFILTFSVLGGIGIGAAYVCPIATCVKWFPDKKGLITGLAVAGFGAGAFFFAPLAKGLISGVPYELLGVKLFPLPELEVFNTFLALGIIFLVAVVAAPVAAQPSCRLRSGRLDAAKAGTGWGGGQDRFYADGDAENADVLAAVGDLLCGVHGRVAGNYEGVSYLAVVRVRRSDAAHCGGTVPSCDRRRRDGGFDFGHFQLVGSNSVGQGLG